MIGKTDGYLRHITAQYFAFEFNTQRIFFLAFSQEQGRDALTRIGMAFAEFTDRGVIAKHFTQMFR